MDGVRLLTELLAGDEHRGGLRCRRLYDIDDVVWTAIAAEVEAILVRRPPSHPKARGHVTNWVDPEGDVAVWSLLNRSGRTDDFSCDHDLSARNKWFFHGDLAPTLGELVAGLPDVVNCRINALGPGARLPPHEEHVTFRTTSGTLGGRGRLHLPVATDPRSELVIDGWVLHLPVGGVYLVNHGCVHEARNGATTTRVHVVLDVLLTQRVLDCLCGDAPAPVPWCRPTMSADLPVRRIEPNVGHRRLPPPVAERVTTLMPCEPQ